MVKVIPANSLKGLIYQCNELNNVAEIHDILNYFIFSNEPNTKFCPNDEELLESIKENKFVFTVGANSPEVASAFYQISDYDDLAYDNKNAIGFRVTKWIIIDDWVELELNLIFESVNQIGTEIKIWYNIRLRPDVPVEEDRLDQYRNILTRINSKQVK
jgi:hypothetical protein